MNKAHLRTAFIAVTFFLTFFCLSATFLLQMRMQKTLDTIAALPVQTTAAASETRTQASGSPSDSSGLPTDSSGLPTDSPDASRLEAASETKVAPAAVQTKNAQTTRRTTALTTKKTVTTTAPRTTQLSARLVLNTNSKKIHSPDCPYAKNIKDANRGEISADELDAYLNEGYEFCQHCKGYTR